MQASYRHIVVGNNIPALHTASLSILYRVANLAGTQQPPADQ